jgi:hypothetical protein
LKKSLNDLRDEAFANATEHGFHDRTAIFGELLMLVVSELSEALEADRAGSWAPEKFPVSYPKVVEGAPAITFDMDNVELAVYEAHVRGTVEEEVADAVIRLLDLAGVYGIDLDWHVAAKMAYNKTRPPKHGKKY